MPRSSKTDPANEPGAATSAAAAGEAPAPAKKRTRTTKTASGKKAAARKPAGSAAKKAAKPRARKSEQAYEPSDDEIRIRAYFIAERRAQQATAGDASTDWLEARRQLIDEARVPRAEGERSARS